MSTIWFTSDWHFGHDRDFVWKKRGFSSVDEMNREIVRRHNEVISPEDTVYILGDLMLGGKDEDSLKLISAINGKKIIIAGNHDTNKRRKAYEKLGIPVLDALALGYGHYKFFLSHFPTITTNGEIVSLKKDFINLFGHTHQDENFYEDIPIIYHVGVDSHNCYPVNIEQVITDCKTKLYGTLTSK